MAIIWAINGRVNVLSSSAIGCLSYFVILSLLMTSDPVEYPLQYRKYLPWGKWDWTCLHNLLRLFFSFEERTERHLIFCYLVCWLCLGEEWGEKKPENVCFGADSLQAPFMNSSLKIFFFSCLPVGRKGRRKKMRKKLEAVKMLSFLPWRRKQTSFCHVKAQVKRHS